MTLAIQNPRCQSPFCSACPCSCTVFHSSLSSLESKHDLMGLILRVNHIPSNTHSYRCTTCHVTITDHAHTHTHLYMKLRTAVQ